MKTMWTQFMDMYSGGYQKEKWEHIYINAPKDEAKIIFYNRFGHNPERVTCTCCGEDYSIRESESLEQITAFERGCSWDYDKEQYLERGDSKYGWTKYTLDEYRKKDGVLFIGADEIKAEERTGDIPVQGYVWR